MSPRGNPYDNARAESFIGPLKAEGVYLGEYADLYGATPRSGLFLARVYNRKRLHAALGSRPPSEFAPSLAGATSA